MKHTLLLVLAMIAIMVTAIVIWDWSFQLARITHVDYRVIDAVSFFIFGTAIIPSSILAAPKEEEDEA